jgi:hypothetical protein
MELPSPVEQMLWSADHETGDLSQWYENQSGAVFNTGTGQVSITEAVTHKGRYALDLTIHAGDGEAHAARIFRWYEDPKEAYYSAWFYFPQHFEPELWWNVFQFKSRTDTRNDPMWMLNVGNRSSGQMYLYLVYWPTNDSYSQHVLNLPMKRWVHIEVFYRRATAKTGRITVWQDGIMLFDFNNVQTAIADNVQWSVSNYTDSISPNDVTIYVDDAAISTARLGLGNAIYLPIIYKRGLK